jgi:SAM-dependent methyltransferase
MPLADQPVRADAASPSPCPLCGGPLLPGVIEPRSSYAAAGHYRIDTCTQCGAGTTMPRPTTEELSACYASAYGYVAHTLIATEKRYRSARLLRRAGLSRGRILDVGCMYGFLLDEARALGLDTWGVELSPEPAEAARTRGHQITCGTLDDHVAAHPDVQFDAIFAQHVVEHLPDPVDFFATAARILVPGGKLVVGVPNFSARLRKLAHKSWGWYQVPVHLHHFTPGSLRRLAEGAGLAVDEESTFGGDTLFLALTAAQCAGRVIEGKDRAVAPGRMTVAALGALGVMLRPYYHLGDDELVLIAHRPESQS